MIFRQNAWLSNHELRDLYKEVLAVEQELETFDPASQDWALQWEIFDELVEELQDLACVVAQVQASVFEGERVWN